MNFSTREPNFYKKLFQSHNDKQDKDTFKTFKVPIENSKVVKAFMFHKYAPILSYCKKRIRFKCRNWLNYERALVLNKASLDMICAPSVGEEQNAIFEKVYLLSDTFVLNQN